MNKNGEENKPSSVDRLEDSAEDQEFIIPAQDGDKNAFGKLVMKYQKRLYRFLFMMLKRKDTTEDIMQEAFVKGYMALGTFDPEKPFYPWIATIARNLAINYIKKETREKPVTEFEDFIETIPDKVANPIDQIIEKENDQRFAQTVQSLPEQYRTVFVLRMLENMSYDEIAKKLNISPGTVDSRLHRARQRLVQLLKDYL